MSDSIPSRDDLVSQYLDQLPYEPYPVQEEALLAWFAAEQGVMVCAPTGTGKTLIAEAAVFEALHTRRQCYYTTPLIALTEQKFREIQESVVRWGFQPDDVGLVTGNRTVNPRATVLVVVAEILLNRLLHPEAFNFTDVTSVVMDEFHSFADPERGIVWELSLALLPKHVRLLLLSATVGNSAEFIVWLSRAHQRRIQLVQSTERKIPLSYHWIGDQLLNEHLEWMASGGSEDRKTPALVFCFNREECWSTAEQLKGKSLLGDGQQKQLVAELEKYEWNQGVGPKLRQILLRGVGVHHAGLLPKYKRIVEELFQKKLLSVCVCTETLAAGINLPARSVVLTTLVKGPPGKKKLIDASSAHQMFGRAGRPQFDTEGFVYALAHEDDVKILRWKEKYDAIPEDTRDPNLIRAKKQLKKKMPTRRSTEQYWNVEQFEKLKIAPPGKLYSKGPLPWRLLAYLLKLSPEVERVRTVVSKRLMDDQRIEAAQRALDRMLMTLWAGGYVTLEPEPPPRDVVIPEAGANQAKANPDSKAAPETATPQTGTFGALLTAARQTEAEKTRGGSKKQGGPAAEEPPPREYYRPMRAHATPALDELLVFRSVNPLYGAFLVKHLGTASDEERIQALESVLEVPGSMAKALRVPRLDELPPGPLALTRLDPELIARGLVTPDQLQPQSERERPQPGEEPKFIPKLADKLRLLFESDFPGVEELRTRSVWAAGELLQVGGDFNKYVTSKTITKQEGVVFRHFLRLILLCEEFAQTCPPDTDPQEWQAFLRDLSQRLTEACRKVDPQSTEEAIQTAHAAVDVVTAEVVDAPE